MVGIRNGVKVNEGMKVRGRVSIREKGRIGFVFYRLLDNFLMVILYFDSVLSEYLPYQVGFAKLPCFEAQLA